MRANLLEVVPERPQHFDLPPVEICGQDERVQRSVARAPFVESANRVAEPLDACDERSDTRRTVLDLVAIKMHALAVRKPGGDMDLSGHPEPEIAERRERLDKAQRLHRIELERRVLGRSRHDGDPELGVENLEMLQVEDDFLGRRRFAIDAAASVVGDPAQKEAPAFTFPKPLDERTRNRVQPGSQDVFGNVERQVFVDRMIEAVEIEIENEHVSRPDIFGCGEADGTEAFGERAQ